MALRTIASFKNLAYGFMNRNKGWEDDLVEKAPGFAVAQRMLRQCLGCAAPLVGGLHVDLLSRDDGSTGIIP